MKQCHRFFLYHYRFQPFEQQQKAKILLGLSGAVFLSAAIMLATYLPRQVASAETVMSPLAAALLALLSIVLLRDGRYNSSAHLLLTGGLAAVWWTMFSDDFADPLVMADSIVLVLALLSLTPLVITVSASRIVAYFIANGVLLVLFTLRLYRLGISGNTAADYFVDNAVALAFMGIVSGLVFTLHRRALARSEASESRYRGIFETATDLVFTLDAAGRFTQVNPASLPMTGWPPDALIGKDFSHLLCEESHHRIREVMDRTLSTRVPLQDYQVAMKDRQGRIKFLEIGLSVLRHGEEAGLLGSARDVSARVQADQALKDSEARFRSMSKVTAEGICFHDKGRIVDVNDSLVQLTGHDREALLGADAVDLLVAPDHRRVVREKIDEVTDRPREIEIRKKDGTVVPVEILNWKAPYKDRILGTVSVRDITRRKKNEQQLIQMQKMEALGTLAGGIAHDFNNLLAGILGNVNLLQIHAESDPFLTKRLQTVETLLMTGADHARQLLVFTRGAHSDARATDLNRLVRNTAELFGRTRRQIVVEDALGKDLWPVQADASQLEQVALNLFLNAGDAMPEGGRMTLETANTTLGPAVTRAHQVVPGAFARFTVRDTGHGMDKKTCDRVFEPFYTTKEVGKGTGLGLASAYGIVKNHGGFIEVSSRPGAGTVFSVYLPAGRGPVATETTPDRQFLQGTETVLLVDDEAEVRAVGRDMLEKMGYTVMSAPDGQTAIRCFEKNHRRIDLVILDMVMPETGGGMVFDALRAIDPDARVLLATGYSHQGEAGKILDRGCSGFLQKPFGISSLSRKVREILDKDGGSN